MPVLSSIVVRTPSWLRTVVLILLVGLLLWHPAQRAQANTGTVTLAIIAPNAGGSYLIDTTLTFEATPSGCDSVPGSDVVFQINNDTTGTFVSPTGHWDPVTRKAIYTAPFHTVGQFTVRASTSCFLIVPIRPLIVPVKSNPVTFNIITAPPPATQLFNLASSVNPSIAGQSVTFTATLLNSDGGCFASFSACPTGTVTFLDGTTAIGTYPLFPIPQDGTHGSPNQLVFVTTTALGAGTHSITAAYGGDSRFAGSTSAPLVQVVTAAPTTTAAASPASAAAAPAQASTTASTTAAASPAAATTAPSQASTATSTTAATTTTTATAPATASQPGGAASGTSAVPATGPSTGMSVTYPAGWNLVAGCAAGMPQAVATLYTFQAQDTDYESSPNTNALTTGQGYWAFFALQATVALPSGCAGGQSVRAPGGRYIMLGNSTQSSLTLHGLGSGDQALTYNASTGQYTDITGTPSLAPGQGAWVYVATDATLSLG